MDKLAQDGGRPGDIAAVGLCLELVGSHVYATQFHPELDAAGLCTRIDVYKHAGYFEPGQADELKARAHRTDVSWAPAILRQFVHRYGTAGTPREGSAPGIVR